MATARISTFRIGSPRRMGEGLRIGVTRRPPRGVPRARWAKDDYFDVWMPALAPSRELLARVKRTDFDDPRARRRFFSAYERELARSESRQTIDVLAALAARTPISVGCFCEDEARCHRHVLVRVLREAAAKHAATASA